MAVTINLYDHAPKKFANGEVNLADLKLMLLGSGGTFTAADTDIGDVDTDEVTGGGVSAGGITIASAAVTTVATNSAKLDAADISVTATGADIGPAEHGVIYEVTSGDLLAHINFDGAKTAGVGTDFKINWHADGIITWTY